MPKRKIPLVTNKIYHLINRGVSSIPIFKNQKDYQRFVNTFIYYQNIKVPLKFSKYIILCLGDRNNILKNLKKQKDYWVEIITYCLMPNHYHILVKQTKDNGIYNFIRLLSNSYSHYFNTKYKRKGALFGGRFKAVRIETDEQLLHVSRYIHLNPYTSYLLKDIKKLFNYSFSSLPEYLNQTNNKICQKKIILNYYSSLKEFKQFILDQVNYQKNLELIKHKLLELLD